MSNVKVESLNPSSGKAIITAEKGEINTYQKQALDELRAKKQVPGFRKGKAPDALLKSKFAGEIENRSINLFLQSQFKTIEEKSEHKIHDITNVELKEKKNSNYCFEISFSNTPYVLFGKFKDLNLQEDTAIIEESDIEKEIRRLFFSKIEKKSRDTTAHAQKGDFIIVETEFWQNDVPMNKPEETSFILGDLTFHKEIEEQIIEKHGKLEDEFSFDVSQGEKSIKIIATIKKIQEVEYPELTDELIQENYPDDKNVETFKANIKKSQEEMFHQQNIKKQIEQAVEKLVKSSEIYFPEGYVDKSVEEFLADQDLKPEQISESELKQIQQEILDYLQKNLIHQELLEKAQTKISGFEHEKEFFTYLENSRSSKVAEYIKNLYRNLQKNRNNLSDYEVNILDSMLKDFHWNLIFNYFKTENLVKSGKKEKYSEYMKK